MLFWIIFGATWGTFAIIGLILLAGVPSTEQATNGDLVKLVGICGAAALVVCLLGAGLLHLARAV